LNEEKIKLKKAQFVQTKEFIYKVNVHLFSSFSKKKKGKTIEPYN
jgi:hypothetical protein